MFRPNGFKVVDFYFSLDTPFFLIIYQIIYIIYITSVDLL